MRGLRRPRHPRESALRRRWIEQCSGLLAKRMGRGVGRAQLRMRKKPPLAAWRVVVTVTVAASKFFGGKQLDSETDTLLCVVGRACLPWFEFRALLLCFAPAFSLLRMQSLS